LPKTASAKKRARQARERTLRNRAVKSRMRTMIKKFRQALAGADLQKAERALREAVSAIDKAAQKGTIHRNQAARRKARLARALSALRGTVADTEAPQ